MTPPDEAPPPMVTEAEIEEWSVNPWSGREKRLIASYERTLGLLEQAHRAFLFLIDDGAGMDSRVADEAEAAIAKALREAGRDA